MNTKKFTTLLAKAALVACTAFTMACGGGDSAPAASAGSAGTSTPAATTPAESKSYDQALADNIASIQESIATVDAANAAAAEILAGVDEAGDVAANVELCKQAAEQFADVKGALDSAAAICQKAMPLMQVGNKIRSAGLSLPSSMDGEDAEAVSAFVAKVADFTDKAALIAEALTAAVEKMG